MISNFNFKDLGIVRVCGIRRQNYNFDGKSGVSTYLSFICKDENTDGYRAVEAQLTKQSRVPSDLSSILNKDCKIELYIDTKYGTHQLRVYRLELAKE